MFGSLGEQFSSGAESYLANVLSSPSQLIAAVAVTLGIGLVIAGAMARTMLPLRWLAVGSDLSLLVFGALSPSYVTMATAAALLPINVYRAMQITRLARRVRSAEHAADHVRIWLKPYMKSRTLKAGQTLFNKGDKAKDLFLLVEGRLELAEIGKSIEPGRIFGEIALFSPAGVRTRTVMAVTNCTVLQIDDRTVKQLFYQQPAFGFQMISMLAEELTSDLKRTESRYGELETRYGALETQIGEYQESLFSEQEDK